MNQTTETHLPPIGAEQLQELTRILQKYKEGKTATERRIISSENWWKLRNHTENDEQNSQNNFISKSGWIHNVIVSKHADAMEAYPEPNILPREETDRNEAEMLSAIIPCVLEQNHFENTYNTAMWRKMKSGTAVYKIVWDTTKWNGLGDIGIECVNILNLFWEPGITDIQKSRYFFHTELYDKDLLTEQYPQLCNEFWVDDFLTSKFLYDDYVDTNGKATVIECYYHKYINGKNTLQYVKYVNDTVLYATENDFEHRYDERGQTMPPLALTGLYDHARYPYVFDTLFPIEGSPCGYGYVDICRNPQTEIDLLKTCFLRNARIGSVPRYFSRADGTVNEDEFLDLENPIVHVAGGMDDHALRPIEHHPLDGSYLNLLEWNVKELRETSGNTETATGTVSGGVTAAAAIASLQEASGKGSRDSNLSAHRAYAQIVEFCIELIRQFYHIPRKFRILGPYGTENYIRYTNEKLLPQIQSSDLGTNLGLRTPIFDIKVFAQKKNAYTKATQNELALQFFKMGFFHPQKIKEAILCLELMNFDGKDLIMQKLLRHDPKNNEKSTQNLAHQEQNSAELRSVLCAPEPQSTINARKQALNAPQIGGGSI